jgi:glycosyltransferase involved in cell wall biosynthesis
MPGEEGHLRAHLTMSGVTLMETQASGDWRPEAVVEMSVPDAARLPSRLLYATSAGLGGTGLNTTSLEGALAAAEGGFLGRVLCFGGSQRRIERRLVLSLDWHPVRLLSFLESQQYYAAKKRYVSWMAERELRGGRYDAFHGWSGDCFRALVQARLRGARSVLDIPTWHRNKGRAKGGETRAEREARLRGGGNWRDRLEITRKEMLAEYDLADLILLPSRVAGETFLAAGVAEERLAYVGRGVDVERFQPGETPDVFRVCFVGALIRRKGAHLLLEAWHRLKLKDAELVLVGTPHPEIQESLRRWSLPNVRVTGFCPDVAAELRRAAVFAFPSECEGFAKATLEAAACGLPLIATAESGDAVVDGETGRLVPPNDVDALCAALEWARDHRDELARMGVAGRRRVESCLTWEHYRRRLLAAYARVMT